MSAKPIVVGQLYEVRGFGCTVQLPATDGFAAICAFLDLFKTKE